MKQAYYYFSGVIGILLLNIFSATAQTRLPKILSSNMILQRNAKVPVWGWAAPGQQVRVQFGGQSLNATVGADSSWKVQLGPFAASNVPKVMTITAGRETKQLVNILVGEVWLCSGQSNMEYPVDKSEYGYANPAHGIDSAALELKNDHPGIRVIKVEHSTTSPDIITTGWHEAAGEDLARSSVVAYFFAKNLQAKCRRSGTLSQPKIFGHKEKVRRRFTCNVACTI